jgi:uncharacterized protein (DUF305 family)
MNQKIVLLILGFILGLFSASFYFLNYLGSNPAENTSINLVDHSNHLMQGMPSMNSMMTEYSDLEYLNLMIIHHQDALDMAQRALVGSTNNFIKSLSENIISTQSKEITEMKSEIDKIINQN